MQSRFDEKVTIWDNIVLFHLALCAVLITVANACNKSGQAVSDDDGFTTIFDGKTLDGWEGDSTYWRVEDGALVGEVTPETILDRNSFIIWQGDMPSDFELKVEYRISANGNSGINYRSEIVENVPFAMRGYQADLDGKNHYTGMNYEERKRTTLASIGEKVVVPTIPGTDSLHTYIQNNQWITSKVVESLGNADSLKANINNGAWNDYYIIANGNHLRHYVNGALMSEVVDRDTVNQRFDGLLGVQVHVGPPMKVEFRNFQIKNLNN